MKIVVVAEWFSEKMGYVENFLPKAFGKNNHEVHLITTDLQVYATSINYDKLYQKHLGNKQTQKGVFKNDYFTLHRCSHAIKNGIDIPELETKLIEIKPDLVYCFEILRPTNKTIIKLKRELNYKIFCESRLHFSVFLKPNTFYRKLRQFLISIYSRAVNKNIDLFYPIAEDVKIVITKYFGISEKKCKLSSLAVETDLFSLKLEKKDLEYLRFSLGYNDEDIVCLYTGRFTNDKGPLILAMSIDYLHQLGFTNFKGLFVGDGDENYIKEILKNRGCKTHPFVEVNKLPFFYQAFDIGVWPKQESTSQLDAAASGMPIIISDKVMDSFRIEGNGLNYKEEDYKTLSDSIIKLKDRDVRKKLGFNGSEKIFNYYSWNILAKSIIEDFNQINK